MVETTVKQRAFAFIIDRLRVPTLGYPALFTPALFLAQWTHRHKPLLINPRARDSARLWSAWRRSPGGGGGGGGGGGVLTIFWVTGRLGPFDPPFSTYVEF